MPSDIATKPQPPDQPAGSTRGSLENRRRHFRYAAGWPATCRDEAGFNWTAWVVDHSAGGVGLSNCPSLRVDQVITVSIEQVGTYSCRVAWSNKDRCGVEFLPDPETPPAAALAALAATFAIQQKPEPKPAPAPADTVSHENRKRTVDGLLAWLTAKLRK